MNKKVEYRLDNFIDDVLNSGDDEVDIKECHSYKSLVRDLEIAEIFKKYLVITGDSFGNYLIIDNVNITKQELKKIKKWLEDNEITRIKN